MSRAAKKGAKTAAPVVASAAGQHDSPLIRRELPLSKLPFVADVKDESGKKRRSFWNVPPADDYGDANRVGEQYACDFLQWLKTGSSMVGPGMLGQLVDDMAKIDRGNAERGYAVGFWSAIETVLQTALLSPDHYRVIQAQRDRYVAAINGRKAKKKAASQGRAGRQA